MKKGLVLEGGGLRGAYTAGVCAWMVQHGIDFDVHLGISSGAMYAIGTALKDVELIYGMGVTYPQDKHIIGFVSMLKTGRPVNYDYLFDVIVKQKLGLSAQRIRAIQPLVEYGVYNLELQETQFINQHQTDDELLLLKAATVLPIAGADVKVNGKLFMDGGVTTMIPIRRARELGVEKMIVVTTKADNFVRKDNAPLTQFLLDVLYRKYKRLLREFRERKVVYNGEMAEVKRLAAEGPVLWIHPSQDFGAKRFAATPEQIQGMYDLGQADCEARKAEILNFFK
jgi:predicted patatin/cPLA2 family phospholipase